MHKTSTFLKFSKKEGGTITATTSAIPANAMELNPSKNRKGTCCHYAKR